MAWPSIGRHREPRSPRSSEQSRGTRYGPFHDQPGGARGARQAVEEDARAGRRPLDRLAQEGVGHRDRPRLRRRRERWTRSGPCRQQIVRGRRELAGGQVRVSAGGSRPATSSARIASASSLVPGQAADADGADTTPVFERRHSPLEEREERVEAGELCWVVSHLVRQRARGRLIGACRRVGLALSVRARIGSRPVHRRSGNQLAVLVGDIDGDRTGGRVDHKPHDLEGLLVPHAYASRARAHRSSSRRMQSGSTPRASARSTVRRWNGTMSTTGCCVGSRVTSHPSSCSPATASRARARRRGPRPRARNSAPTRRPPRDDRGRAARCGALRPRRRRPPVA